VPEVCVDIDVPKVMISDDQRKYLRGWGEDFVTRAKLRAKLNNLRASRKQLSAIENLMVLRLRFNGAQQKSNTGAIPVFVRLLRLAVVSDCSGVDSWLLACQELNIPTSHVSSCDNAAGPMKFIARNYQPRHYYHTLFDRTLASDDCDVYVAGFPCKAFSLLESESLLLNDPRARPFFLVRDTITQLQPKVVVLENVVGLLRVQAKIFKHLRKAGEYLIHLIRLDPVRLGTNISRDRVYILMIRKDSLGDVSLDDAVSNMNRVVSLLEHAGTASWTKLLYPASHSLVKSERKRVADRKGKTTDRCFCIACGGFASKGAEASLSMCPTKKVLCKWRSNHWAIISDVHRRHHVYALWARTWASENSKQPHGVLARLRLGFGEVSAGLILGHASLWQLAQQNY
jgi:site-specific DNA-cytosine methylase